jgi:4'-phosphopantetheinyl transferase
VGQYSLPDGTAEVWWARRQDASACDTGLLDEIEQQRLAGYRRTEDGERFVVGCTLAKTLLARYTGRDPAQVRFDRTCGDCGRPHGRPVLVGAGDTGSVRHSVSHSGDVVVVAMAQDPVGVDVEQLDGRTRQVGGGDADAMARLVMSGSERAVLAAVRPSGRAREFLVAWTRKEAVTKATGDGLSVAFSDVVVAADTGPPRVVSWPYPQDPGRVSLHDLEAAPGYVAALAVIGRCAGVRTRDGSALLMTQT